MPANPLKSIAVVGRPAVCDEGPLWPVSDVCSGGRPLPVVDVRYSAAQVEGQLSGGEVGRLAGTDRPIAVCRRVGQFRGRRRDSVSD